MFKDKGINLIGKLFNVEKREALGDKDYGKTMIQTILSRLDIGIPLVYEKNIRVFEQDNFTSVIYVDEVATVFLESFKDEASVFISLFIRKKFKQSLLCQQLKLMAQNYGAGSMNYQIFYRP